MTVATKYTPNYTPAALSAIKPLPRPLNVVGPYSVWPRNRGVVNATPVILGGATLAGATIAHCVAPVLI